MLVANIYLDEIKVEVIMFEEGWSAELNRIAVKMRKHGYRLVSTLPSHDGTTLACVFQKEADHA